MLDPLPNLLVESVLHSHGTILVGDPVVLAQIEFPAEPGIVPIPAGNAVVLHASSPAFVWVAGSSEVATLTVTTHLDSPEGEPAALGHVDCPSGRIVVGTPEAVAAWGDEIQPDDGLLAQARAYRSDRRHCGHVIVARVLPGRRQVLAVAGAEGIHALVVDCAAGMAGLLAG